MMENASALFLFACGLATLQHGVYASPFFNPAAAKALARNHSRFITWAYFNKVLTVLVLLGGAYHIGSPTAPDFLYGVAIFLGAFGFYLNWMVHVLLGTKGIYYGYELGLIKPGELKWTDAFPYSAMNHPQYTGASLQIISGAILWGVKSDFSLRHDVLAVCVYMVSLYIVTTHIEKLTPPFKKWMK